MNELLNQLGNIAQASDDLHTAAAEARQTNQDQGSDQNTDRILGNLQAACLRAKHDLEQELRRRGRLSQQSSLFVDENEAATAA